MNATQTRPLPNVIIINNHAYEAAFECPCPIPGRWDCTIADFVDGVPAYWQDGVMYVRRYEAWEIRYILARPEAQAVQQ